MTDCPTPPPAGDYAIVELFGHQTLVGRIAEVERFGTKMLAIEPLFGAQLLPAVYHGGASIYRLTPCSAEAAARHAPRLDWQLPKAVRAALEPALLTAGDAVATDGGGEAGQAPGAAAGGERHWDVGVGDDDKDVVASNASEDTGAKQEDGDTRAEADDEPDLQSCEACDARGPAETFTYMSECWFCPTCTAEWRQDFAKCEHEWVSTRNEHGDAAGYCKRCSGIVPLSEFPALGFDPASVRTEA